jgi:hypothetical protein
MNMCTEPMATIAASCTADTVVMPLDLICPACALQVLQQARLCALAVLASGQPRPLAG